MNDQTADTRIGYLTIFGVGLVVVGLAALGSGSIVPGIVTAVLGAIVVFGAYASAGNQKDTPAIKRIAWLQEQIAQKKRIVDS